jgi:hypothetical protein
VAALAVVQEEWGAEEVRVVEAAVVVVEEEVTDLEAPEPIGHHVPAGRVVIILIPIVQDLIRGPGHLLPAVIAVALSHMDLGLGHPLVTEVGEEAATMTTAATVKGVGALVTTATVDAAVLVPQKGLIGSEG